jgi:hypothetical protein
VFGISYSISSRTRFALKSAIALQASYPLHACAVTISANLVRRAALARAGFSNLFAQALNQINAIPYATRSVVNISAPALSSSQPLSSSAVDFATVANTLASFNYSTTLSNRYPGSRHLKTKPELPNET